MVMQSPLFAEMQRRRLRQFANAAAYGAPDGRISGVPIVQHELMPPGLYQVLGELCRGGIPWSRIPDPIEHPRRFEEWAKGWVEYPLVWEGDYA